MPLRFVVDGMLGSLARKLRIFGFDTAYSPAWTDEDLLRRAAKDNRILVTSDKELHRQAIGQGERSCFVYLPDDETRLAALFAELKMPPAAIALRVVRCPKCNGLLDRCGPDKVSGRVPQGIQARVHVFYMCRTCGSVYWEGSHWKRLTALAEIIRHRVEAS